MAQLERTLTVLSRSNLIAAGTVPQGLVVPPFTGSVIIPYQMIALPRVLTPYVGDHEASISIGSVVISTVAAFTEALNLNVVINLLQPFSAFPLAGKSIADLVNQNVRFTLSGTLTGGAGELVIVTTYQVVYPLLG